MAELRTKIIACPTVGEELKSLLPNDYTLEMLEYGLHNVPESLHEQLQAAIDATGPEYGTILLGYGLCANAILELNSRGFRLVIPRADDCITLFLGSRQEYLRQLSLAPGTFFLTKGWIECGEDPYMEYCSLRTKYGHERAFKITKRYIQNYTRLALINSGSYKSEAYRKYARMVADYFDLTYEEIPGSNELLEKFVNGAWEKGFVVVPPGQMVKYDLFYGPEGLQ
ncbi:MAG: DUF1638 domain-containing protein [Anaerolineales bacterium]|jgi:hypothetical protein